MPGCQKLRFSKTGKPNNELQIDSCQQQRCSGENLVSGKIRSVQIENGLF